MLGGGMVSRRGLRLDRRKLTFAGVGLGAFLAALIATIPAAVVIDRDATILARAGTIWSGEVALAGGDRLSWKWAPLRSLINLGFAVDWQVTGPESDLAGRAVLGGEVQVDTVSGRAGGGLIGAVAPYLPFRCVAPLQIEIARASATRMEGEIRSAAGSCSPKTGGAAIAVPALLLTARPVGEDSMIVVAPAGQPQRRIVDATLADNGRMKLVITPDGARVLPFAVPPGSAGVTVETTL